MNHGARRRRYAATRVLITGAARGIGAATAARLLDEGATVIATDNDADALARLPAHARLHRVRLDVTSTEEWERAMRECNESVGGLDVLFHNAGVTAGMPMAHMTDDHWNSQLQVNLMSAMYALRAAIPLMQQSDRAAVVVTSSIHAVQGFEGSPAYAAAKAALLGLVRQQAVELAPEIRVNAVVPGIVAVERFADAADEVRERWATTSPLRRVLSPHEVASVVAFLGSADASAVTGQAIVVDGGASVYARSGEER